ncbi:hypothetical protein SAMN05216298_2984 [Glycomyces sambucus]|uniref:Uncharacterized protein n=1 Tax=Glycomyces sambucus TaxID=380244 RepID=A0A1G9I1X2_9ACTN|nr:hypothetical protein [Glycomyces sambucus]SDL19238.1 hypothetical protein SAMN05216298_2984 [Glycomyces sambucus]
MRIRTRIAAAAGVMAVASATGIAVAALAAPAPDGPEAAEEVLLGQGSDHLPSITADDWVTYADHVVVVEAVSEQALEPDAVEVERGEGVIGRIVSLTVEDVLWSREGAPQPAPATWEYSGLGWTFTDGDLEDPIEMALDGFPRVEVGHEYVMAIRWEEAVCTDDGDGVPAQWRGLGEGSEVPFDEGVLGNGESEGTVQDAAAFAESPDVHLDEGVEELLVGEGADAIVAALTEATADTAALTEVQEFAAANSCE